MGDQLHAEYLGGGLARCGRVSGQLNTAAFAATSGVDLRLDHDFAAEIAGGGLGLVRRSNYLAFGHGPPVLAEALFGLALVDFHGVLPFDWEVESVRKVQILGKIFSAHRQAIGRAVQLATAEFALRRSEGCFHGVVNKQTRPEAHVHKRVVLLRIGDCRLSFFSTLPVRTRR